jgi:hypothetical protein
MASAAAVLAVVRAAAPSFRYVSLLACACMRLVKRYLRLCVRANACMRPAGVPKTAWPLQCMLLC